MKKTLIALAALACSVASAVDINDAVYYTLSPSVYANQSVPDGTLLSSDSATAGNSTQCYTMTAILNWKTISGFSAGTTTKMVELHINDTYKASIAITKDANNNVKASVLDGSDLLYTADTALTSDMTVEGKVALTLSYGDNGMKLYALGADNTAIEWSPEKSYDFSYGGEERHYNKLWVEVAGVEAIYVFDEQLSHAEVSAFSVAVVPEPATATLSLLALAGLAARRRRK